MMIYYWTTVRKTQNRETKNYFLLPYNRFIFKIFIFTKLTSNVVTKGLNIACQIMPQPSSVNVSTLHSHADDQGTELFWTDLIQGQPHTIVLMEEALIRASTVTQVHSGFYLSSLNSLCCCESCTKGIVAKMQKKRKSAPRPLAC